MNTELKAVQDELLTTTKNLFNDLNQKVDENRKMASTRLDELQALMNRPQLPIGNDGGDPSWLAKSIWDSPEFQMFKKTGKGRIGIGIECKSTITSAAIGSGTAGILRGDRVAGIVKPGVRRVRVRELLPNFATTAPAVEVVRENVFTNLASPQVEASAKSESALTFTIVSVPVRTLAHWVPVTAQAMSDFEELRSYIEMRLIDGLRDKEDSELLLGDGTGVHLSGMIPAAVAYDTSRNVALDTRLDTLNHGLAQLNASEFEPDGIVLHPTDWRKVQLLKEESGGANTGSYLLGSPASDGSPVTWGLPVATTTAMPVGKFLVGAFRTAAAVYDRLQAIVEISNSHENYFTLNLLAVRAEERICLCIMNPNALVYGSFV